MIAIECENEALKKSVFEFFRMKFPKDYKTLDLKLEIKVEDEFIFLELKRDKINISDKLNIKNEKAHFIIKRYLFDLFSNYSNFDAGFGILTGVRPLKLISKVFDSNTYEDSVKILFDKYRIKRIDSDFLYKIYKNQKNVRKNSNVNDYNIYVHIPFCPSRCSYCSFDTTIENKVKMEAYTETLIKEIQNINIILQKNLSQFILVEEHLHQ